MNITDWDPHNSYSFISEEKKYLKKLDKLTNSSDSTCVVVIDGKLKLRHWLTIKIHDLFAQCLGLERWDNQIKTQYTLTKFLLYGASHRYFSSDSTFRMPEIPSVVVPLQIESRLNLFRSAYINDVYQESPPDPEDIVLRAIDQIQNPPEGSIHTSIANIKNLLKDYYADEFNQYWLSPAFWTRLKAGIQMPDWVTPPIMQTFFATTEDPLPPANQEYTSIYPIIDSPISPPTTGAQHILKRKREIVQALPQFRTTKETTELHAGHLLSHVHETLNVDPQDTVRVLTKERLLQEIYAELCVWGKDGLLSHFSGTQKPSEVLLVYEECRKLVELYRDAYPDRSWQDIFHFVRDCSRMMAFQTVKSRTYINQPDRGIYHITKAIATSEAIYCHLDAPISSLDRLLSHVAILYKNIGCFYPESVTSEEFVKDRAYWSADFIRENWAYFDTYFGANTVEDPPASDAAGSQSNRRSHTPRSILYETILFQDIVSCQWEVNPRISLHPKLIQSCVAITEAVSFTQERGLGYLWAMVDSNNEDCGAYANFLAQPESTYLNSLNRYTSQMLDYVTHRSPPDMGPIDRQLKEQAIHTWHTETISWLRQHHFAVHANVITTQINRLLDTLNIPHDTAHLPHWSIHNYCPELTSPLKTLLWMKETEKSQPNTPLCPRQLAFFKEQIKAFINRTFGTHYVQAQLVHAVDQLDNTVANKIFAQHAMQLEGLRFVPDSLNENKLRLEISFIMTKESLAYATLAGAEGMSYFANLLGLFGNFTNSMRNPLNTPFQEFLFENDLATVRLSFRR